MDTASALITVENNVGNDTKVNKEEQILSPESDSEQINTPDPRSESDETSVDIELTHFINTLVRVLGDGDQEFFVTMDARLRAIDMKLDKLEEHVVPIEKLVNRISNGYCDILRLQQPVEQSLGHYHCCICTTSYKDVVFHCGHSFCQSCVDKQEEDKEGKKCPICRKVIEKMFKIHL